MIVIGVTDDIFFREAVSYLHLDDFHRFGTACDEHHVFQIATTAPGDDLGQLLQRVGGEVGTHEALYASTDPVALDVIGWNLIENLRKENNLPTLKAAGREPSYLKAAAELGLGIFDTNKIRLRDVKV